MTPQLLILQATSLCNLDCTYCYVPARRDRARMSEATLRAALQLLLTDCRPGDAVRILWQAGEPLAAGLAFYERAAEIIARCRPEGVDVTQVMQTNGTLIDERWCQYFLREGVQVGVSVDGPAAVHDRHRRSLGDGPTHARVMRGVDTLRAHGLPLHALAVITPHSLAFADEVFDFFVASGFETVGFNLEETEGVHSSSFDDRLAQTDQLREAYRSYMTRLFDRWQTAGRKPRIREFEAMGNAIGAFLRDHAFQRQVDDLTPFRNIVVTREGELSTFSPELASGTPSDPRRFSIGNVHQIGSIDELIANRKLQALAAEIGAGVERCRTECEYFPVCGGGTASNKFYEHGSFDCTETTTCALTSKTLLHVVADGLRKRPPPESCEPHAHDADR